MARSVRPPATLLLSPEGWSPSDGPPTPPDVTVPGQNEPPVTLGRCVATGIQATALSRAVLIVSPSPVLSSDVGADAKCLVTTASDKVTGRAAAGVRTRSSNRGEWRDIKIGETETLQPGDQIALRLNGTVPRWVYTLKLTGHAVLVDTDGVAPVVSAHSITAITTALDHTTPSAPKRPRVDDDAKCPRDDFVTPPSEFVRVGGRNVYALGIGTLPLGVTYSGGGRPSEEDAIALV